MQALYWHLSPDQREKIDPFDIEVVEDAVAPVESSPEGIRIHAEVLVSLLAERRVVGTRVRYPSLTFILAHELAHWVVPEAGEGVPPAQRERAADRFAIALLEAADERMDVEWLAAEAGRRQQQSSTTRKEAKARLSREIARLRLAFSAGPSVPANAADEVDRMVREAAHSTAHHCVMGVELSFRVNMATLERHRMVTPMTTSPELKAAQVNVLNLTRAALKRDLETLDACLSFLTSEPPATADERKRVEAMQQRSRDLRHEGSGRLAETPVETAVDDPTLYSRDEQWRNAARVRASASIAPALTLMGVSRENSFAPDVEHGTHGGWLLGAGITYHGNNFWNGAGLGFAWGRLSASVPADLGAEEPAGMQTSADVRTWRLGLRNVAGRPLAGRLMGAIAIEVGYFNDTYRMDEVEREFVDHGLMLLIQGELALRITPGVHLGLGLQFTPLIGDVLRYDFAAPFSVAGYL